MTATVRFEYTGGGQVFTVPPGVTSLTCTLTGGVGAVGTVGAKGAAPGYVQGTIAVSPGTQVFIHVGCSYPDSGFGGYTGGGSSAQAQANIVHGYGGGGYSDVRVGANTTASQILVAGGSGGAGYSIGSAVGGAGGRGGVGPGNGGVGAGNANAAATGATATAPGTSGAGSTTPAVRQSGGSYTGASTVPGGGGGGGYYGGGAGSAGAGTIAANGGGGGSNHVEPTVTNVTNTTLSTGSVPAYMQGVTTGAYVTITYDTPPNAPTLIAPTPNQYADAAGTVVFSWQFSDPDTTDSDGFATLQYRPVGGAFWFSVPGINPGGMYAMPPNTMPNGVQIEWQVQSSDAAGLYGPFSASSFFNTEARPTVTLTDFTS